jgi:hypothetical protein
VGLSFAALTGLALSTHELFGLGGWLRQRTLAQQIDTSGPLEISEPAEGFTITRPSERWGQVPGRLDDVFVGSLQKDRTLVLVQPARYAFIDVRVEHGAGRGPLDRWQQEVLKEFEPAQKRPGVPRPPAPDDDDDDLPVLHGRPQLIQIRPLAEAGREGQEMLVDVRLVGQSWRFLVRIYRQGRGPVYILRAYTQVRRFAALEAEMRQALDSFRIVKGR